MSFINSRRKFLAWAGLSLMSVAAAGCKEPGDGFRFWATPAGAEELRELGERMQDSSEIAGRLGLSCDKARTGDPQERIPCRILHNAALEPELSAEAVERPSLKKNPPLAGILIQSGSEELQAALYELMGQYGETEIVRRNERILEIRKIWIEGRAFKWRCERPVATVDAPSDHWCVLLIQGPMLHQDLSKYVDNGMD